LGAGRWQRDIWLDRTVVHETAEAIAEQMSRSARYRAQRLMRVLAGRLGGPRRPELDPHGIAHRAEAMLLAAELRGGPATEALAHEFERQLGHLIDTLDAEHAGQGLEALHLPDPQAAVAAPLRAP